MSRLNALILVALLSGCATHQDFLGNAMPEACLDVSDIDIQVIEMPEAEIRKVAPTEKAHLYGAWLQYVFKPHVILISEGLTPTRWAEVLHHEKCHEKMWRLTGNGEWH